MHHLTLIFEVINCKLQDIMIFGRIIQGRDIHIRVYLLIRIRKESGNDDDDDDDDDVQNFELTVSLPYQLMGHL